MAKKPRENRIPIMMSDEELQPIDDWRFENRIATRSDAVRQLCSQALYAHRKSIADRIGAIKLLDSVISAFEGLQAQTANEDLLGLGKQAIECAATFLDTRLYSYGQMRDSAYPEGTADAGPYDEIVTVATFVRKMLLHVENQRKANEK